MIKVDFDNELLAKTIREAIREELQPVMRLLENRKLSVRETMDIMGIKSPATISNLIRQRKLHSVPDSPNGRPKFLYSEVMKLKKGKHL